MLRPAMLVIVATTAIGASFPAVASDWTLGPPLNTARTGCGVAIDPACRIYATGGRLTWTPQGAAGTASDRVEVLDANDLTAGWTIITQTMLTRREYHATACVNGFLYVFGGSNTFADGDGGTVYFNTAERLDLLEPSGRWESITSMPTARNIAGAVVDDYGRIYVIGGSNGADVSLDVVERFDPARNVWDTLPPLHDGRGRPGVAKDVRGRIYVIGGGINGDTVASVERLDPAQLDELAWELLASIPDELQLSQAVTAATGADGRIYLPGGITLDSNLLTRCIRYDPLTNEWASWVDLLDPRAPDPNASVVDCNGRVWLIGAGNGTTPEVTTFFLSGPCGASLDRPLLLDSDADSAIEVDDLIEIILRWGVCP